MELLAATPGLYFFARDGEDYLLNVNGQYSSHTLLLTPAEVERYVDEGTSFIASLAKHYSYNESAAIARQVPRNIPIALTRQWRIDHGLPVYDETTNSWITVPRDET